MTIKNIFTPQEVAEKLKVSLRQVYRWIESKKLKTIKLGRRIYRIQEEDLLKFLKKHKVKK